MTSIFFHANVIKYCNRPYKDVNEMNEDLIRRHNSVVKPEDTVYHLGDFSLSKSAPQKILPRLNGIHHMRAIGNHDHCHPVHAKTPEKLYNSRKIYYDAGFKTLELDGADFINDELVQMCHFPFYNPNPEFDQRYPKFRPEDKGYTLLHGHVHNSWKTKLSPKGSLMINVGVDVWDYYPVEVRDIEMLIREHRMTYGVKKDSGYL